MKWSRLGIGVGACTAGLLFCPALAHADGGGAWDVLGAWTGPVVSPEAGWSVRGQMGLFVGPGSNHYFSLQVGALETSGTVVVPALAGYAYHPLRGLVIDPFLGGGGGFAQSKGAAYGEAGFDFIPFGEATQLGISVSARLLHTSRRDYVEVPMALIVFLPF
jgi:hypothetical protein